MECTRYSGKDCTILPHEFYVINISDYWGSGMLFLRPVEEILFFLLSLSLSYYLFCSLLYSPLFFVRRFFHADFCNHFLVVRTSTSTVVTLLVAN